MSRRDDDGAGDGGSEAQRTMIEGEHGGGTMGSTTGGGRREREARCSTSTGLGPRGMRVRHCPPGSVSLDPKIARGPSDHELFGRSPAFSPQSPPLSHYLTRPVSCRFPLRRKSGAHRTSAEIGPVHVLTYFFSEGTYMSAFMTCHLLMDPLRQISIDSRPPLLASGAHSIGFSIGCRMVVCCFCIDLT